MAHRYGIYQSTSNSCIFYKQDDDGHQSTFNLFITPSEDEKTTKMFAFIDNEEIKEKNWFLSKDASIKELIEAFGGWAADAPVVFELEAERSMSQCLNAMFNNKENEK